MKRLIEQTQAELNAVREESKNLRVNLTIPQLRRNLPASFQEESLRYSEPSLRDAREVITMLNSAPEEAKLAPKTTWLKVSRDAFMMLIATWNIVEPVRLLFDGQSAFTVWTDNKKRKCFGMRHQ